MDERWHWEAMPAEAYIHMISDGGFLGDPLVKTQHLLGATWWERLSDTEVIGHHQLRAAHNRFTDLTFQRVDRRGHGHATNEHFYRKVDGVWKFAGLRPKVRWNEYDFEQVFKGISFEDMPGMSGTEEKVEGFVLTGTEGSKGEGKTTPCLNERIHSNGTAE